jgi:hypothetical protein
VHVEALVTPPSRTKTRRGRDNDRAGNGDKNRRTKARRRGESKDKRVDV